MLERTQSFDMNGRTYEHIQQKVESILQNNLMYSVNTLRLGKSLVRINYYDETIDKEIQKDNRITILKEPEKKVYIQIKGQLTDDQVRQIWSVLESDLTIPKPNEQKELILPTKEDIIEKLIGILKLKGYNIENYKVKNFIENFQEKYKRLPKDEEINSIVKGYIIMVNEDYLLDKAETSIKYETSLKSVEPETKTSEDTLPSNINNNSAEVFKDPSGRRKCPSCGDESSIHEVTDKNNVIMDYPRIYGKKKYCGNCSYEWR